MASTSGSVYGNNVDGSEGSYLNWQLAGQDVAGNYSVINWQAGWRFSSSSCRGLRLGEAYIDGATVYYNHNGGDGVHTYSSGHNHKPQLQTASGQITVHHNSDGTKNGLMMTVRMTGWNGGPNLLSEANGWFDLPSLATAPAPPSIAISSVTSTSALLTFADGSANGATIDAREIWYGTDPNWTQLVVQATGWTNVTGLTPGTTYYFWGRTHNSQGWSSWSGRVSALTLRVADAPSAPTISSITQVSAVASFTPNGNGGAVITAYEVGWGTDPSAPTSTSSATSPTTITGLSPGTKYYFWTRALNSVGWSRWSVVTIATTIAGARIKVGSVWKDAVPYVKVNGVWKLVRPWSRIAGVWKEST